VCNSVQQKSGHATAIDHERLSGGITDPDFPGSAAVCLDFLQLERLALARARGFEIPPFAIQSKSLNRWRFAGGLLQTGAHRLTGSRPSLCNGGAVLVQLLHRRVQVTLRLPRAHSLSDRTHEVFITV
jgi:hypothetical protein